MSNKPKKVRNNFIKPIKSYKMPKKPKRKDSRLRIIQEMLRKQMNGLIAEKYGNGKEVADV